MNTKIVNFFNNIPNWVINLITVCSGLLSIVAPISSIIMFTITKTPAGFFYFLLYIPLFIFIYMLIMQTKKYRKVSFEQLKVTSRSYHSFFHETRDIFFNVMQDYKKGTLDIKSLSMIYQNKLILILNLLCDIMKTYTGEDVYATIKFIADNKQDLSKTKLITFCRSSNSTSTRGNYEIETPIYLADNTDFLDIVDPNRTSRKNYFYQGDLKAYDKALREQGKKYKNSNPMWEDDYLSTIVVPIRIKANMLLDKNTSGNYDLIGFLCLDSMSKNAFTQSQESFNVDIMKSFADGIYLLLSQYRHYLNKLSWLYSYYVVESNVTREVQKWNM